MRIGLSTSVIQRGKTGIAQYVFALLRALSSHVEQHHFVLFVLEEDLSLFDFAKDNMQLVLVPERFRPPVKNILWHQTQLPKLAREHALDVLHVPSYRRMLWPKQCPLVATIHDLAPFRVANKYDWKRMFYGKVIVRRLAHRQDRIIAISQNTARDITAFFGLPSDKIEVIYNGIEHQRFFPGLREPAKGLAAQRHGLTRPFFLYTARLEHPAKNHVRLVTAFDQFKSRTRSEWQLVFAGSDWHGADAIHAAIARSPFAADIRCLGFVRDEDLPDLYRAADVLVYPSLYEGFGLPPLEAMACGCPVVSSTRGSLGEVIGDAAAIVEPENIAGMAEQLNVLANDSQLRERLRGVGIVQARKFDWQKTAAETLKVYHKGAAAKPTKYSARTGE
jgi:glycosyltransferase involved in cell wall biosynthesis